MRPVDKRKPPEDSNGNPIKYDDYRNFKREIIHRLGEYCSYCEMPLSNAEIEHKLPKSLYPEKECDWENLLLVCKNCNTTKGAKDILLDNYFWPDKDNTFKAFYYQEEGLVFPHSVMDSNEMTFAQNTLDLFGLSKIPTNDSKARDRRLEKRKNAWGKAKNARLKLQSSNTRELREQIIDTVITTGFWSVWLTIFADDQDMVQRIFAASPGICKECFDESSLPLPRPGGRI